MLTTPQAIDWRALAEVGLHDTKIEILRVMATVPAPEGDPGWSPRALAEIIGKTLGVTSYHVRLLADDKRQLITLVDTRPARGALQHFYGLQSGVLGSDRVNQMVSLAHQVLDDEDLDLVDIERIATELAGLVIAQHEAS